MLKHHNQKQLREGRVYDLTAVVHHPGKSGSQWYPVRKQSTMRAGWYSAPFLSPFLPAWDPSPYGGDTHMSLPSLA